MAGATEYLVHATTTGSEALPTAYTGCHAHATELFCLTPGGDEVLAQAEGDAEDHTAATTSAASSSKGKNCHFHAGVE